MSSKLRSSLGTFFSLDLFKKKKTEEQEAVKSPQQPKNVQSEEEHAKELALLLDLSTYDDLSSFQIDRTLTKRVPYSFVKKHFVLPVAEGPEGVTVVTSDPLNIDAIEELRYLLGGNIITAFVPKQAIMAAIHEYYHGDDAATEILENMQGNEEEENAIGALQVYDLLDDSQELPSVVRLLNYIISEAIQQNASDIHFEPKETGLSVRYRIDGVLQTKLSPSQELTAQLLTRLKVMAKLDIAEKRLPQDGRIKMRMGGKEVDFRVSTLPVVTGERIVLRILDKGNIVLGLDKIGFPTPLLAEFRRQIGFSEGIILVTGPTGSGKTTTLYSALTELKDDHTNIMTIEDPVEYRLKGISQMGVHPKIGLTFAAGLRHILRQDPDVIMVGEIRDKETAEIAIQAALTGHLVLSTLHTNDAPSAIARLVDMGIEPYLISSCCIGIMAQRLVRKICPLCKTSYTPTASERDTLKEIEANKLYKGAGCSSCLGSGYQGRHGVYELMPITNAVRKQILHSPEATQIQNVACAEGMMTLRSHSQSLALQGITTMEEVWRVTRAEETSSTVS
ncbi:MAG: type II secretion system ATPase GspE [Verrucomicrobia bacterium]|nr:type II secretion system ATPase GspE [Verrucomicrobiota bacterium]